ncbi:MAG: hypothetical protein QOE70_5378 [Chthoniobacter sp.]|jgi:hypothetical protein|nr:hypothetical protein [Chthoniobacter sp.]
MAIVLEVNYAKTLGLPNYSSHQYSVTIRTELTDLTEIEEASTRLYALLQDAVDRDIQHIGFIPDPTTYGMNPPVTNAAGENDHGRGNGGNGSEPWRCSVKQRGFIERLVRENGLDKNEPERLAVEMFGVGAPQLDRPQASGLIDELLERHGGDRRGGKRPYRHERVPANGGGD